MESSLSAELRLASVAYSMRLVRSGHRQGGGSRYHPYRRIRRRRARALLLWLQQQPFVRFSLSLSLSILPSIPLSLTFVCVYLLIGTNRNRCP